jgi:glycosyltransferase involved in cell wall biosynthesis
MTRVPAVSLIVQTYHHERFVDRCLASVDAQTLDDFEVVIIDDCSTDGTVDRIRAWLDDTARDARLITNTQNLGICASRNRALRCCRGEFLSTLSGDDFYEPDKLERHLTFFRTLDESVAAVFSDSRIVDERGAARSNGFFKAGPPSDGRIFECLLARNFLRAPAVMTRRSAVESIGGYDESLFYDDYDLWLRLADRYEFRFLSGIVVNKRVLSTSVTRSSATRSRMNESRARLLMKWLGRDPELDDLIIRRARSAGVIALAGDRPRGRAVLELVRTARPNIVHRGLARAAALPGSERLAAAALALRAIAR